MGNITELSQGNLDGLKKQVCECIEHAQAEGYKRGYTKGKNDGHAQGCHTQMEKDKEKIDEAKQEGYNQGYADGKKEPREEKAVSGYNTALKDFENLYVYENDYKEFFLNVYAKPFYENVTLFDAVAKYGIEKVMDDFKKWQEEKAEEEWKIGDELYSETTNSHAIIVRVNAWNSYECFNDNGIFKITDELKKYWVKIGHFDEVGQLLDKLKGDK